MSCSPKKPSQVSEKMDRRRPALISALLLGFFILTQSSGHAASQFQFDIFFGYNDIIRQGSWFPVACEIYNDGPEFKAVFELTSENGRNQVRQMPVELPSQTRKRFIIPVFASGWNSAWTARLVDENGKVRVEKTGLRPQLEINAN